MSWTYGDINNKDDLSVLTGFHVVKGCSHSIEAHEEAVVVYSFTVSIKAILVRCDSHLWVYVTRSSGCNFWFRFLPIDKRTKMEKLVCDITYVNKKMY